MYVQDSNCSVIHTFHSHLLFLWHPPILWGPLQVSPVFYPSHLLAVGFCVCIPWFLPHTVGREQTKNNINSLLITRVHSKTIIRHVLFSKIDQSTEVSLNKIYVVSTVAYMITMRPLTCLYSHTNYTGIILTNHTMNKAISTKLHQMCCSSYVGTTFFEFD